MCSYHHICVLMLLFSLARNSLRVAPVLFAAIASLPNLGTATYVFFLKKCFLVIF